MADLKAMMDLLLDKPEPASLIQATEATSKIHDWTH